MTYEERERMNWLCVMIQDERNVEVYDKLLDELTEMLERGREKLGSKHRTRLN